MSTRKTSEILREIEATQRKLKRYKAARKTLKLAVSASIGVIIATAAGLVDGGPLAAGIVGLGISLPMLMWLTFHEDYGFTFKKQQSHGYRVRGAGTGQNVFDFLEQHIEELREELSEAGAA